MTDSKDTEKKYSQAAEELLEKLRSALQRDGDFPASAKVVNELKMLASQPKTTANQITEVILREPSLGTRVLHVVNSSFYRRAKPIMTVSQAVVQIGMRPLSELCSGLVLLQKFVPAARSGGPFANCLKKVIVTSLLASEIVTNEQDPKDKASADKNTEQGYLCGSFFEIGTLLLAYYFPKIYDSAVKRAETKKQSIDESIQQLTGLTPLDISLEVLESLSLPEVYRNVIDKAREISSAANKQDDKNEQDDSSFSVKQAANCTLAARDISAVIVSGSSKGDLEKVISAVQKQYGINPAALTKTIGDLPSIFSDHCSAIELNLPALPEFVSNYTASEDSATSDDEEQSEVGDKFSQFVDEIRESVEAREPTASIITSVMETLAWGLDFDRVLLLLVTQSRKSMTGRMSLGPLGNVDPRKIDRPLGKDAGRFAPDAMAYAESRPIFNGDPVLEDGWPFTAIPIGYGQRTLGVIYADRTGQDQSELEPKEQAAIGVLAELLDRSVGLHSSS